MMKWPLEPLDGNTCLSQRHSWAPLQVLHGDTDVLFPVSGMGSFSPADAPIGSLENGTGPEDRVLPDPGPRYSVEASSPGQGSPLSSLLPSASVPESMTINELRQAIVAMMNRKDELEEENRSLRNLLDGEMEHSAALRQEVDTLKRKVAEQEERHVTKIQALARENEVLKVQLKKYVGAVQMLKREGQTAEVVPNLWNVDGEVTVTEQKPGEVAEELASSYERKLIEVAEMHGELIEFNERLHRALVAKEALVSQMRQELIDLRGPVPGDLSQTSEDQSLSDFEISNRALINVWIPSVFLRGKAANAFHVYQVYIRIKDDEWNVYRRYTEFRSLHHKLQNKYPQVRAYNFPPKKAIGNKETEAQRGTWLSQKHVPCEGSIKPGPRSPISQPVTPQPHQTTVSYGLLSKKENQGCQVCGGTKEAAPELPAQCHEQSHPDGPRVCHQSQERDPRSADALLC
ncbi:sorting nexin 29 [Phyllostomus discolor]|uniref:Sorting nexin 29 n=1 Tax=Phyllostomus discolor TaxID=89673 RepID=A0A834B706_9CHIR|nr:sorting nexin 29 [Phyllostomus discolor]